MIAKRTSGVIVLPAAAPPHFVGSLASGVGDDGGGWIQISFFNEDDYLRIDELGDFTRFTIRRELMETILGAFSVLLAANGWMRQVETTVASIATCRHFEIEAAMARHGQPGLVRCSWRAEVEGIELSHIDGQVNVRFREDLARALASDLACELGRIAAAMDK
jgi:hypothetical protein